MDALAFPERPGAAASREQRAGAFGFLNMHHPSIVGSRVLFTAQVCHDEGPYLGAILLAPKSFGAALLGPVQTPDGTVAAYSTHDLVTVIAGYLRSEYEESEQYYVARQRVRGELIPALALLGPRRPLVLHRGSLGEDRTGVQYWFHGEPWIVHKT